MLSREAGMVRKQRGRDGRVGQKRGRRGVSLIG